jgi:hypothetical protein
LSGLLDFREEDFVMGVICPNITGIHEYLYYTLQSFNDPFAQSELPPGKNYMPLCLSFIFGLRTKNDQGKIRVIVHHGDTEALRNDFRRKTYRADNWGSDRS